VNARLIAERREAAAYNHGIHCGRYGIADRPADEGDADYWYGHTPKLWRYFMDGVWLGQANVRDQLLPAKVAA
jgi:hypothetical protein